MLAEIGEVGSLARWLVGFLQGWPVSKVGYEQLLTSNR